MRRGTLLPALTLLSACSSGAFPTVPPAVSPTTGPGGGQGQFLYVLDGAPAAIRVFPASALGDVVPSRVIAGANTGLLEPTQISEDAHGYLYVSDAGTGMGGGKVVVFAPGVSGNVKPVRTIEGSKSLIASATGVAVEPDGTLLVASHAPGKPSCNCENSILLRFPPKADGNVAPEATSGTDGDSWAFQQVGFDPVTGNAIVARVIGQVTQPGFSGAVVFGPNLKEAASVSGAFSNTVAVDSTTKTYVLASDDAGILRLSERANGCATFNDCNGDPSLVPPLLADITSDPCTGFGVSVGADGSLYVANATNVADGFTCSLGPSVSVYASSADGNVAPVRILSGALTGLSDATSVTVGL